jgi:folate-binding protein YgfZ
MDTPLQAALRSQANAPALSTTDYRGAAAARLFSDPQIEFDALRTGCGAYDLGFRAKISLTGGDRVRWLNGMVTNNIRDLAQGHGLYAFLLNPQGRILGDMVAYNCGDSLLVDTDRGQVEKILATFDHYIIMDDVEVSDLSEKVTAVGVSGPKSREVLKAAGFAVPQLLPMQIQSVNTASVDCTLVRGEEVHSADAERPSYEIWLAPEKVKQLWEGLLAGGATPVGAAGLEMDRIVSGIPLYAVDIRERDLPQETEQARALNFSKGCYVGQEIVERIRSRGNVHRKFTGFVSRDGAPLTPGAKVMVGDVAGEKEVGEITSATTLPGERPQCIALGYIRREHAIPHKEVTIAGRAAWVAALPFADGGSLVGDLDRKPAIQEA